MTYIILSILIKTQLNIHEMIYKIKAQFNIPEVIHTFAQSVYLPSIFYSMNSILIV